MPETNRVKGINRIELNGINLTGPVFRLNIYGYVTRESMALNGIEMDFVATCERQMNRPIKRVHKSLSFSEV